MTSVLNTVSQMRVTQLLSETVRAAGVGMSLCATAEVAKLALRVLGNDRLPWAGLVHQASSFVGRLAGDSAPAEPAAPEGTLKTLRRAAVYAGFGTAALEAARMLGGSAPALYNLALGLIGRVQLDSNSFVGMLSNLTKVRLF